MRNSCCLFGACLSTKIKKGRNPLSQFQLLPCRCCCQNSSALFWGVRGEMWITLLQRLQMCQSWAGRNCFLFHVLLDTGVQRLGSRDIELGQQNARPVATFGKITKQSCQWATSEQEGIYNSLCLMAFVFLLWKMLSSGKSCWRISKNVPSCISFHNPEVSMKLLFLTCAPGLLVGISQTCAIK